MPEQATTSRASAITCERGRGPGSRATVVDPRGPWDRAADDRARHYGGQHRAALGAEGAALLQQQPRVDRDRVRARVRQPAVSRWAARRSVRPQAAVCRQHDRIRRRVGSRGRGPELRRARDRARGAGRVRRADGARRALAGEHDVHRSAASERPRSGSGERSAAPAPRSGYCSAACSPRTCRGAGRCSSTSDSRSSPRSAPSRCYTATYVRPASRSTSPGRVTATAGLFALVYGFAYAQNHSWASSTTVAFLAAGAVLLAAFVAIQTRSAHPLMPLRVVLDRNRGGSFLALAIVGLGTFGVFLFATYYLQEIKGYSPSRTGLAFLPLSAALVIAATVANARLMPRTGPRPVMASGMALAAIGMGLFAQLGVHSSYAAHLLPALLVLGVGLGFLYAPATDIATRGVDPGDAGVASGLGQRNQPGRRVARPRAPQHPGRDRHHALSRGQAPHPDRHRPRRRPRVHHRVLVGRRILRRRRPHHRTAATRPRPDPRTPDRGPSKAPTRRRVLTPSEHR